ncbi:MAG: TolC family protein [Gemmataceae bacterium]|nr:TolC family protein [Gemmataceae bacterium]
MRAKLLWATMALLLAVASGCKQRCYMSEQDWNRTTTTLLEGRELEPELSAQPLIKPSASPQTLRDLERKTRFISLAECVATALEQGRVGQPSLLFPGTAQDNLVQFTGRGVSGSDAIRVLALDPARAGAEIEAALSRFDAVLTSSLTYTTTDQPIGTPQQTFQAGAQTSIQQQDATASLALIKPLATGGVAGITFNVPYTYTNLPARINPSYRPQLLFQFEQPLMQGFGVEINQLRNAFPTSILNPGVLNNQPTSEGILVTRLRFDQQRAEFERNVNQMLLNVEVAYWNLYGSYWTLYSREQGLRFAYEAFRISKAGFDSGRVAAGDYYKTRAQFEQFRAQRLQAIDTVLENERQLRALLGLPIEDGTRLMPSDAPTLAASNPDWHVSLQEALAKRPELHMARKDVKVAQLNLILAKNLLLPDVRLTSSYDFNSIGTRLDGAQAFPESNSDINAFRGLANGKYSTWTLGIRGTFQLGGRFASVQVRQAQLGLARSLEVLKDQELKAESFLENYFKRISTEYEQIRATRATREAYAEDLKAKQALFANGKIAPDPVLESQRFWADALANEYQAIVRYNNALAGFEFAKGSILQHDNVTVCEGPLPGCAAVRAVEHEKQRTAALVLRERAAPAITTCGGELPAPTALGQVPSLPAAMSITPPLAEVPALPAPIRTVEPMLPVLPAPAAPAPAKTALRGKRESDFGTVRPE